MGFFSDLFKSSFENGSNTPLRKNYLLLMRKRDYNG